MIGLWPFPLIILGQENVNAVDMLSIVRYDTSLIIKCLEEKGGMTERQHTA